MDSRGTDRNDELPVADTPEDVAVLYSWANLHGAKYRDFSASRREYRAQLRHRASEQTREQELKAQAEAEGAVLSADAAAPAAARQPELSVVPRESLRSDSTREQALREAGRASRMASAERVEAARRAEAAAMAEAGARRAEREIAEANASARRQAAWYADSEMRSRESEIHAAYQVPGEMSDPYTPTPQAQPMIERRVPLKGQPVPVVEFAVPAAEAKAASQPEPAAPIAPIYEPAAYEIPMQQRAMYQPAPQPLSPSATRSSPQRRPQGYRPDDASGVRQIYRGLEVDEPQGEYVAAEPVRMYPEQPAVQPGLAASTPPKVRGAGVEAVAGALPGAFAAQEQPGQAVWPFSSGPSGEADFNARSAPWREISAGGGPSGQTHSGQRGADELGSFAPVATPMVSRPASPYAQPVSSDPGRGRRAQDDLGYKPPRSYSELTRQMPPVPAPVKGKTSSAQRPPYVADPSGPAWLYAPPTPLAAPRRPASNAYSSSPSQSSVADTLQHSRERVAARWFALKGVFEQPGQEQQETPIRQKETRTPVLAVFSLAGGVGKTSLVATLGRALSSLGEKVLLTDTTSHGLLPFYFGASELRQGVVRTFSPPSGSTDAPIYLVSYDVDQRGREDEVQQQLVEEIAGNSKGTHRILLDLTPGSGWITRRMAAMNPTVLVPLAPDMNSVISLQAVEKYFSGIVDSDGRPVQPYFVINQFDASLPLHLDVREVLRRQLGERLLPFVIRRSPAVSEALAEGMTVMDYAPETPIAEDYQNVAAWLRTIAAPATAGFRNVRWSER
jgi:cellulose synthase operon protein YhjQ